MGSTRSDDDAGPVDGRVARRQRNVNVVLDVVLDMFGEESLFPTIEQAATRSGLSLRSLYRYFADPAELLEATIIRSRERGREGAQLHAIGEGPLEDRIEDFVAARLRIYDSIGPVYRATVANAARLPRIHDELTRTRDEFRAQFAVQFALELKALDAKARADALSAGDLVSQLDSVDFLRRHRGLSETETKTVIASTLRSILHER